MADLFSLAELPKCPEHNTEMKLRTSTTEEQRFCGVWYDCQERGCYCSKLYPSKELLALHEKVKKRGVTSG